MAAKRVDQRLDVGAVPFATVQRVREDLADDLVVLEPFGPATVCPCPVVAAEPAATSCAADGMATAMAVTGVPA